MRDGRSGKTLRTKLFSYVNLYSEYLPQNTEEMRWPESVMEKIKDLLASKAAIGAQTHAYDSKI